jgi:LPS-assembly lipoprotein
MFLRFAMVTFACAAAVGGCSYRPLYGGSAAGGSVAVELAAISIPEAETRVEQIIRNDLLSAMRPAGSRGEQRYRLEINPTQRTTDIIDKPKPSTTRQAVTVSVEFSLLEGSRTLYSGRTFSQVSYDLVRQPFADLQAENNAVERAAHELAADIRERLAAYFASH